MKTKESITEFYTRHGQEYQKLGQFNIYHKEKFACDSTSLPPNRRDFYKISLILNGEGIISSAEKAMDISWVNHSIVFQIFLLM